MSQADFWARYHAQRRRLLALEARTARELERLWRQVPLRLRPAVDRLLREYAAELASVRETTGNPHATVGYAWLWQRLVSIQREVQAAVHAFAAAAAGVVTPAHSDATTAGAQDASALLHITIGPILEPLARYGIGVKPAHPAALDALRGRLATGQPLAALFAGFGPDAAAAARDALMSGMFSGSNPTVVARLLDTALGISRNRALTIARTEMLGAYRTAALAGYRANSNVVEGWYWQTAADGRCCAACAYMQGSFHTLDETLDGHVGDRCTMLPKTKSYADILGPLGIDASDIPETSITVQSGADWFAGLSDEQQRSILGTQGGYDAYKAGDVTLADFAGVSVHPVWGRAIYQRSLKDMGINPQDYKQ